MGQELGLDAASQVVGPKEFGERGRVLGVAAGAAQLSGQAAPGIVLHFPDALGDLGEVGAPAVRIIGIAPAPVVHEHPEAVLGQTREVGDHIDQHLLHALVQQRPRQVVVVHHVRLVLGARHHRDHVPPQELRPVAVDVGAPLASLLLHFAQAHGDLGGPKLGQLHRIRHRFGSGHGGASPGGGH